MPLQLLPLPLPVLVAAGLLLLWLLVLTLLLIKSQSHYHRLTQGITKKDLRTILEKIGSDVVSLDQDLAHLRKAHQQLASASLLHLQKVGFVRFNPFSDTGGDQSFCLCLLDRHDTGVVISSLHSRDQTRIYAKRIIKGKAEGELSREELSALKAAQTAL